MNLSENRKLTTTELNDLYQSCINGIISKNGMHETIKAQLINYAEIRINKASTNIFELLNSGILTSSMIGNDFEAYLISQTKHEQSIIDWLTEPALQPQQIETKTEQEQQTFKNNFDNITPSEIHNHFKAGLVEKGYFTEQELNEYLKAAFELKKTPETLFKIKNAPTKQKVMKVFYEYYKNIAGKPHKKQSQYAALLGDYFEGFNTQNVSTNFNK